jgi:hypothetical protein
LSLQNQACQTQLNVVVSKNTTIPTNTSQQNAIVYKSSKTSCNFSFKQQPGYQLWPEQHCYFAAVEPIAGNLTGYNVTSEGIFDFNLSIFENFFKDIMALIAIVVILTVLCCLRDMFPRSNLRVDIRSSGSSTNLNRDSPRSHHMALGITMCAILALCGFLWCAELAWPEWFGMFAATLCFYTIIALDILTQKSEIYSLYTVVSCSACLIIQLFMAPYTAWLLMGSAIVIISKAERVSGNVSVIVVGMIGV